MNSLLLMSREQERQRISSIPKTKSISNFIIGSIGHEEFDFIGLRRFIHRKSLSNGSADKETEPKDTTNNCSK
jgi:hypothetical protein